MNGTTEVALPQNEPPVPSRVTLRRLWMEDRSEAVVHLTTPERRIAVRFAPENLRKPGHVRREIYFTLKMFFPNYQRTIPRDFRQ